MLMAAFCVTGFAQSAPVTAKKATLMGDNAQVKDVKTGQVLRVAKASKQAPSVNGTIQMSRNGVATPSNSTNPNSNGLKRIKEAQPCDTPELKVKETTPAKNMKAPEHCNNVLKMKGSIVTKPKSETNFKPNSSSKKQSRTIPKNVVILKEQ